jgi:hypothetical protein
MNPRQVKTALMAAGGLGVSASYLIWMGPFGPGFAVWVLMLGGSATVVAWVEELPWRGAVATWSGIAVLAAAMMSWRAAPELQALFFLALVLAGSMVVLESRGRSFGRTRVLDHAYGAALTAGLAASGGFPLLRQMSPGSTHVRGRAWALARGLLLAGPPVLVFVALFANADPAFERGLDGLTAFLSEDVLARLALLGFFGWISAGLLRGVLPGPRGNPIARLRLPRVGVEETAVVLGLVTVLFAAFVALQLGYLFGGRGAIESISGLTVAEYARRGFFELVAAAGLVLALLLALGAVAPTGPGRWVYRSLAATLVGLVLVVIASAVVRLQLYVDSFGLTTDRLYAAAFMSWITVALVWFAGTVIRGRPRPFASGAITAGLVTVFALGVLNPHALVARTNLSRGVEVDYDYLWSLEADAVPHLLPRLAAIPAADRCDVARLALRRWGPPSADHGEATADWRRWNAGTSRARRLVANAQPRLQSMIEGCPVAEAAASQTPAATVSGPGTAVGGRVTTEAGSAPRDMPDQGRD